jgi:predicted RNA-binding Zn-ribbon protein involved in translation (DUF1610 family)
VSGVENWASIRGRSRLRVVAERRCEVCDAEGLMELVSMLGLRTAVSTPCPHCGTAAIEIRLLPWRDDTTRSTA